MEQDITNAGGLLSDRAMDRVAIGLSLLCLLHCLAIPLALLLTPAVGALFATTETETHWVLLAIALPISVIALAQGHRRHGHLLDAALGGVGLVLMTVAVTHLFGAGVEALLTSAGVLLLLIGHALNLRHTLAAGRQAERATAGSA